MRAFNLLVTACNEADRLMDELECLQEYTEAQEERAKAAEAEVVRLREALAFATNTPFMNQRTVPYPPEEPNP